VVNEAVVVGVDVIGVVVLDAVGDGDVFEKSLSKSGT